MSNHEVLGTISNGYYCKEIILNTFKKNKKIGFNILRLIITGLLLGYLFYKNDLGKIYQSATSIAFLSFLLLNMLQIVGIAINALKWKVLLPDQKYFRLVKYNLIGRFYSLIMPGQMGGEVVKAYLISKNQDEQERFYISVFIDKITSLLGVNILFFWGIIFSDRRFPIEIIWATVIITFAILFLFFMTKVNFFYQKAISILENLLKYGFLQSSIINLIKIVVVWNKYSKKTWELIQNASLGIIYQLTAVIMIYLIGQEMGLGISFIDWVWLVSLVAIVLFLPISLAGLGIREGSFIVLLSLFSIPNERAVALSLIFFSLQLIASAIGGVIEVLRKVLE